VSFWGTASKVYQDLPLDEFIIGRWHLLNNTPFNNYIVTEVEFTNSKTMLVDIETPEGAIYNIMFQYEFIGENRIRIRGRLGDEWQLTKKDDELVIDSNQWPGRYKSTYQRLNNTNEPFIAFVLVFFVFGTAFINFRLASDGDLENTNSVITNMKLSDLFNKKLQIAIISGVWILGVISGSVSWSFPFLLKIGLPWDSVFSFELSVILLILGIKIFRVIRDRRYDSNILLKGFPYLGIFLVGNSCWGIVAALIRLMLFIFYGSYFS
jgi:hypothetical protein